jgi:hypothetical protein
MKKHKPAPRKGRSAQLSMKDLFLQPWFLDRACAAAIRRMVPELFVHKMRFYFEDWGCLMCKSKTRRHGSNGFCHQCTSKVQKRLYWCMRKRALPSTPRGSTREDEIQQMDRVRIARTLLSDLVREDWSPNRLRLRTSVRRINSVNSPGLTR